MESDNWAGLGLLLAATVLALSATGADIWLSTVTSFRLRALAEKGVAGASVLLRNLDDRRATLAVIGLARGLGTFGATAIAVHWVLEAYGVRWDVLVETFAGLLVAFGLSEALLRRLISLNPGIWTTSVAATVQGLRLFFRWPAWFLDLPFRLLARRLPIVMSQSEPDSVEELVRLVEVGTIGEEHRVEREMIRHIVDLGETTVREIMVPRIDLVAVEVGTSLEGVARLIMERGKSRIPLYQEGIDNIVGVIYAKDILGYLANGRQPTNLREVARPPYFIPEAKRVDELLAEMRQARVHMAIVVDEYGGTAGLVTIEDLLEEIVGEIADEYDTSEEEPIQKLTETEAIVDARVSIDAFNEMLGLAVEKEDFDTVGGFVYQRLGKVPGAGDQVQVDGYTLSVLSVLGHRIKKIRVTKEPVPDDDQSPD